MKIETIQKDIITSVNKKQSELNQLIQQLIRIRSYSGEEKEIVEFILKKMTDFCYDEASIDSFGNVVGRIGNGPIKILYDAHIDTVKVTEKENWCYPPFEGRIVNGKIYGRGVVDEKPAMAGFLIAGKVIKSLYTNINLPFTLYINGSVMEEDIEGYPLLHLIEKDGIKPDYVLLGEPTDLHVYRGQRGRMEVNVSVYGKSAHGAHNQQGINAIYKMANILNALEEHDLNLPHKGPLGKGSLTVSQIASKAPSSCSVPDFCQIHIDRRLTMGEDEDKVIREIEDILKKLDIEGDIQIPTCTSKSWKGTIAEQKAYLPPWILEENHPMIIIAQKLLTNIIGKEKPIGLWDFSTNGVVTAGVLSIPTIGFAPGKEELSHSDREELELNDLLKATQFYAVFPFMLCEEK